MKQVWKKYQPIVEIVVLNELHILSKKIQNLGFKRLERAYHKHHTSKDIKLKKVSIPIMITNKMRMELSTLGWSREEMKSLRPKCAWQIIKKGVPKKPPIDRAKNL